MMISKTDRKIIVELQKDGRMSYTELAAKLGISISTAAKRTEALLKSKIVDIRVIPNPFVLGLTANAMIALQVEPAKTEYVNDQLMDIPNISSMMNVFGRYDILLNLYYPNWDKLHTFIDQQLSVIEGILKIETFYIKEFKKRYERMYGSQPVVGPTRQLSDFEWQLIDMLNKDARVNYKVMAEKFGMHVSTISRRVQSLLEEGAITICAIPNPLMLGYSSSAFMILDVAIDAIDSICEQLYTNPDIVYIAILISNHELVLGVQSDSNMSMFNLIKEKISQIKGIRKTETFVAARPKKFYYGWRLSDTEE